MTADTPFHPGELEVQRRAGVTQAAQRTAAILADEIPTGAMPFVARQTMAVFGSRDARGNVWASLQFGCAGFIQAESERRLLLRQTASHGAAADPLWENLLVDPRVGILLIELSTRRRLRINGRARRQPDGNWRIEVERAYGNCPKYIQARRLQLGDSSPPAEPGTSRRGSLLNGAQQAWISHADTFFVASAQPDQGLDASHRGGRPGFVQVINPYCLRVPDYVGNNLFNTLGNFTSYPHAGLVFPDFERNRLLQMTGRPRILWDEPGRDGGPLRYWEFEVESWNESQLALDIDWRFVDYSPYLPAPTDGQDSSRADLTLRIEKAWKETNRVKGFELVAADHRSLPQFEPGAHLPVRVQDRDGAWVERNYSLLSDPADRHRYRIGVLSETTGRGGSLYLHERVKPGDHLQAGPPTNAFPLEPGAVHSILIAGGIGITPLLSMLHALETGGQSFELHYSARRVSDLAFRRTIEALAGERAHFYASREPGAPRLDLESLLDTPDSGTHLYVCGPRSMIVAVRELAETSGWAQEQVHFESFGGTATPNDRAIDVNLVRSNREIHVPAGSSILDTLLESGIAVPHDCVRGECSLCVTRVLAGEPEHRDLCLSAEERADSMCLCVSRARSSNLALDL